jgi:hypothetical protein
MEEIDSKTLNEQYGVDQSLIKTLTIKQKRKHEYPSIEDQLDMLYWDKINNTNNWQTTISDVKTKYPKL